MVINLATLRAAKVYLLRRTWRYISSSPRVREINGIGRMVLSPWEYIDSRLYFFGGWEPEISRFIADHIPRGSTCIDIGANIGYYTLLMSRITGNEGRVYSIEPGPRIIDRLRDNINLNRVDNVCVVPFGISDKAERRRFVMDQSNLGASRFEEASEDGLELRKLSEVIPPEHLQDVSMIKMDVEGMEACVLRDIFAIVPQIDREELTIVAEVRSSAETRETVSRFLSDGFALFLLPNRYSLIDYAAPSLAVPKRIDELPPGQNDIALVRA